MSRAEEPWHRFFHTYVGAGVAGMAAFLIGLPLCRWIVREWHAWPDAPLKEYFNPSPGISVSAAFIGAFTGTFSHVALDSIMHSDVSPLRPFSEDNPLLGAIGPGALHGICLLAGILGIWWWQLFQRKRHRSRVERYEPKS